MRHLSKTEGKVYLVGAGPGDAGLITVRGVELLREADCVVYDRLVNPDLLRYAPEDAEIIYTPKRVGGKTFTQQEINDLLIQKVSQGKTVVRLKGGDPFVFGRGSEEATVLSRAGVDFELVPGITAGIASAEYAGIIISDRRFSSQVVFVTGREAAGKTETNIDWEWLSKFNGTIVFYMGVGNLTFIVSRLIGNGMAGDTPAAMVANATLANQRVLRCSLESLPEGSKDVGMKPPAIIIIGEVAREDLHLDWLKKKALFGRRIVVTRDKKGNRDFAAKISRKGGEAICFETITIQPLTAGNQFLKTVSRLSEYNWVVFTSAKGVEIFFDWLNSLGRDARALSSARIAVIGDRTAEKLVEFGIKADFVPREFTSEQLGKGLLGFDNLRGKKVLLLRSRQASSELVEILKKGGAEVAETPLYAVKPRRSDADALKEQIQSKEIDWVTFASPSEARSFFEQVNKDLLKSGRVKIASIGPVTSKQLRELDLNVDMEARVHTLNGLLEELETFVNAGGEQ